MASVTGMTSEKINALLDEMVVSVRVDSGQLVYEKRNGEEVNGGDLVDADFAVGAAWPVNSIYTSTVPTNPHDILGVGTWVRYGQGRVLVGQDDSQTEFDTVNETGGEKTHLLTTAELAAHTHAIDHDHPSVNTGLAGSHNHQIDVNWRNDISSTAGGKEAITGVGGVNHGDADGSDFGDTLFGATDHAHTVNLPLFTGSSGSAGGGTAHNNLQPYIVVYIWKRTA